MYVHLKHVWDYWKKKQQEKLKLDSMLSIFVGSSKTSRKKLSCRGKTLNKLDLERENISSLIFDFFSNNLSCQKSILEGREREIGYVEMFELCVQMFWD